MISVCMATYNGERFLSEQVKSILSQLGDNDELIISDDHSTDNTANIINDIGDPRIHFQLNSGKSGIIGNFENAINTARGDYIFLADQDDIWHEEKVERFLKYFKLGYNVIVSDAIIIDENNHKIGDSFFSKRNSGKGFFKNLLQNTYLGCCMAFDRHLVQKALPFPPNIAMHDIWIGLVAELFVKSIFINDKLISYRRHGENFSPAGEKSTYSTTYKIKYRSFFLTELFKRYMQQ
jgi:glycosyltransferase involved in cell wall biosynthesis